MDTPDEIVNQQRQLWNKFSGGWKRQDAFIERSVKPVNDRLIELARLQNGYTVLDVAAGTGEPGIIIAEQYPEAHVIGSDLAEEMLAVAQERAIEKDLKNYETLTAGADSLPLEDASVDAVTCRFGVMFFPDPDAGIQEMTRVLRPGKRLAAASWAELDKNPWFAVIAKTVRQELDLPVPSLEAPGPFRHAQPNQLAELLGAGGLTEVAQEEVTGNFASESPSQYWEFILDTLAPVANAVLQSDEATQQRVADAVRQALSPFQKGEQVVLPWSAWVASGVKA